MGVKEEKKGENKKSENRKKEEKWKQDYVAEIYRLPGIIHCFFFKLKMII